jgi:hypothetical protein
MAKNPIPDRQPDVPDKVADTSRPYPFPEILEVHSPPVNPSLHTFPPVLASFIEQALYFSA